MKNLATGISDFKEYMEANCYFVDKSALICWIIDHPDKIHLITRPRRFGKTLNLSMIRYFLEAPFPGKGPKWLGLLKKSAFDNSHLFQGLKILTHSRYREFLGRFPVIHLSFNTVKNVNGFDGCMDVIEDVISDEFNRHDYLLNLDCLSAHEKEFFNTIIQKKGGVNDFAKSIKNLSKWLHRAYGTPPYILLDEYDTPLHAAYTHNYYKQMIEFIRSFMLQSFKDNPHLKQAVVIGILKIAQESIFSDFNNPRVNTLMDTDIEDAFGFTESEVETMVRHFGLDSELQGIKEWYDGYLFGGKTVIYNPWSIVMFLIRPNAGFQPHWLNTSDNSLIKEIINLNRQDVLDTMGKFLRGEPVRKPLLTNIPYMDIKNDPDVVWSFLLHSGYLKAYNKEQDGKLITWELAIPNLEVEIAWERIIRHWLNDDWEVNEHFTTFIKGIKEVKPEWIERGLKGVLFGFASYYDTALRRASGEGRAAKGELKGEGRGVKSELKDGEEGGKYFVVDRRENFYHGLVLGLLANLGASWHVDSNREYGMGRPDIVVVKKGPDPAQAELALVLEFKQGDAGVGTPLEKLAREAFLQADEQYLNGVRVRWNPIELRVFGVGFVGKELEMKFEDLD